MRYIDRIKTFDIDDRIRILKSYLTENPRDGIGAYRYLSHLYVLKNDYKEAEEILKNGIEKNPENLWLQLELGDFYFFTVQDVKRAEEVYKGIFSHFKEPQKSTLSPYRYVLKRLTTIAYNNGNVDEATEFYRLFYEIEPSDFYASDFIKYASLLLKNGNFELAKKVVEVGIKTHPKNRELKEFANQYLGFNYDVYNNSQKSTQKSTIEKIPVKTPLIKEDDNLIEIIKQYALPYARNGDIITISSCVAAIAEGRIYPVDSIKVSKLARFISRFVNQESIPFGGAAPLANPYAMQMAIEEAGALRIVMGFLLGAIGKVFGLNGVFYKVAGEQSALIDDPPAAIPPYDYYIIPGPIDSNKLAKRIRDVIGFEVAIVDANELGRAWVVGKTENVNKEKLEKILSDNPAGNEDEGTPIVIVRGVI
ncbi:MAG: coenzyme F420-0:L-glutamate ligase [Caldisericum exile]|uniref:coenzyme F420-0:L-glutamate ligase n=1 Tax=Caldisericum exile TaxID=693075 RepID=UPI003C760136